VSITPPHQGTTSDSADPGTPPATVGLETPATPAPPPPIRRTAVWIIPIVLLFGLWLVLAFSSGGYLQSQWLPPGLGLALFALVVSVLIAYPRRPGPLSMGVLALFGLYAIWVMLSALWASSLNSVWDEAGRTLVYLLALTLALTFFTDAGARRAARYLLLAGALLLVGFAVWRLHRAGTAVAGLEQLFSEDRFTYPVSYPNNAAALYLLLFWPLVWVAADPRERVPVRGLSLATCWGLLALAILTQSRGGFWATAMTLVMLLVLSPARLRTLLYLLVPAALTVWGFPDLNSYWRLGAQEVAGGVAVRVILLGMAVAAIVGVALALLERWVYVSRRMKMVFGAGVLVAVAASAIYGAALFERQVGDPGRWLSDSWSRFTAGEVTALPGSGSTSAQGESAVASRFLIVSTSGRWDIWRVAWRDFRASPWLGVGAGNYVFTYDQQRHRVKAKPRQPHSWELQVLSETGTVGGVLFMGALFLGLGGMLWPRFSAGWYRLRRGPPKGRWGADPRLYAWETMLAIGVLYWLIHGSGEWLWNMPGVSLPAVLMLALGVASVDARAGVLWPRLHAWMAARTGSRATPSETTDLSESAPEAAGQRRRRASRLARRERRDRSLVPPGQVSLWFRRVLVATAAVTIVALALPYLSLRFQDFALSLTGTSDRAALRAARFAARLQPVDPHPLLTEADIYRFAAANASDEGALDDLALSLDAHIRAIERDPAGWALHYRAGIAALRLLEATTGVAEGSLTGAAPAADSGRAEPSLATPETQARARLLRAIAPEELRLLARSYFVEAETRNPLNIQVKAALEATDKAAALTAAAAGGS
jgi:hypothetical protein